MDKEEFQKHFQEHYEYIAKDYHKDRDCHFYISKIERTWSYGEEDNTLNKYPWIVIHHGYVLDYITEYFQTEEECYDYLAKLFQDYKTNDQLKENELYD